MREQTNPLIRVTEKHCQTHTVAQHETYFSNSNWRTYLNLNIMLMINDDENHLDDSSWIGCADGLSLYWIADHDCDDDDDTGGGDGDDGDDCGGGSWQDVLTDLYKSGAAAKASQQAACFSN